MGIASERLASKLALPTIVHLRSYKLQWLSEHGKLIMESETRQKVVLKPLSPRDVQEYQNKMREKRKKDRGVGLRGLEKKMRKGGEKGMIALLKEFKNVFLDDIPSGLAPLRGIGHHIDLSLGASLPNKAAYKTNLEEGKDTKASGKVDRKKIGKRKHEPKCHACDPCTQ
ncbi:hypothetical protein CR513_41772, partial [Mucuna pruriens]